MVLPEDSRVSLTATHSADKRVGDAILSFRKGTAHREIKKI